jgi:hypothetical protein
VALSSKLATCPKPGFPAFWFYFSPNAIALGILLVFKFVAFPLWLLFVEVVFWFGDEASLRLARMRGRERSNHVMRLSRRYRFIKGVSKCLSVLAGIYMTGRLIGWTNWDLLFFAGAGNLVLVLLIFFPSWVSAAPKLKQAGFAVLIVICLLMFSLYSGHQNARVNGGNGVAGRLLISADAIAGLKKLGISFAGETAGSPIAASSSTAQLSDTVEILLTREDGYVVRLKDRGAVLIRRDSVVAIAE